MFIEHSFKCAATSLHMYIIPIVLLLSKNKVDQSNVFLPIRLHGGFECAEDIFLDVPI